MVDKNFESVGGLDLLLNQDWLCRFWQSLSAVTCCRSLVIIFEDSCICQIGVGAESSIGGEAEIVDAAKLIKGTLYRGIMKSGARMIVILIA